MFDCYDSPALVRTSLRTACLSCYF